MIVWNRLHSEMESNDRNEFWRSWLYNKKNNQFAAVKNGCSSKKAIAEEFKKANSQRNNQSKVDDLDRKFKIKYHEYSTSHDKSCSCSKYDISLHVVFDAIAKMRKGKCHDGDGICAEHFHIAPLILLQMLVSLFNSMMRHSFVPFWIYDTVYFVKTKQKRRIISTNPKIVWYVCRYGSSKVICRTGIRHRLSHLEFNEYNSLALILAALV